MPYLQRLFEQSGFSPHALGRIARLTRRCLDADALAIYLTDEGDFQRVYSSENYPASTDGEGAFVEAIGGPSLTVIEDADTDDRLTGLAWVKRTSNFRRWVSAPIQTPSHDDPLGFLVVAHERPRSMPEECCACLVDATRLIVDHLEARRLNARMAQLDRMTTIGTLATGVAHEINNPLSFVGGNVQFALRTLEKNVDPTQLADYSEIVEALDDALAGSRRVRDVVRDLHRLARGSGGDEFTIEPVSVNRAVETSLNIARNHIENCARLVVDVDELPPVMGNEPKLGQVFLNLLVNAAQAIPPGQVEDNEVRVTGSYDDDEIAVEVRDSGEGIPEEHIDSIFEPFFSTKASEEGTGLGLAISKYIVTTLGGDIEVSSKVGEGTTFRVLLPRATSHGPPDDS